jgi:hypothetical protein
MRIDFVVAGRHDLFVYVLRYISGPPVSPGQLPNS